MKGITCLIWGFVVVVVGCIVCYAALWVGVGAVVVHFIRKFW